MSSVSELDIDLEKLFLPAWAQDKPAANRYEKFAGEPAERGDRKREGRRGGPRGEPFGERRGPRPPRSGGKFGDRKREFGRRDDWRDDRRPALRDERPEPPPPLPEISVVFLPDENGVDSLARQIKMTGRAYPLFDIARLILQKPERFAVRFTVKKNAEGKPVQPLFVCALDDTVWLSEDEAVAHVLKKHFATFYQAERTATEPPKGKYTFVAQCSLSGVILGPPNHHDYQNLLRKLHAERFSRMPFDEYKSRVRIVRDEEVVKKWVDDQSWKTKYVCLNLPEPLRLDSMEAVEKHFRETHKENIIKLVDSYALTGAAARSLRSPDLVRLVRSVWEDQRRFPLQIATVLSQQFAGHGLQFFKVNKTVTHVCVARPHYLDMTATPVSEGVKQIVDYINASPKCTRRQLVEALAPSPATLTGETAGGESPAVSPSDNAQPTPEQTAVIADLHWLIHQGHVIEFANGILETAKKPLPKPEPKPAAAPSEPAPPAASLPVDEAAVSEPSHAATAAPAGESPQLEGATPAGGTSTADNAVALPEVPATETPVVASGEPPVEPSVAPVESPS